MKVPNKVLNIIVVEFSKLPKTPEVETVLKWALEGVTKRAAANPAEKSAETFGSLEA